MPVADFAVERISNGACSSKEIEETLKKGYIPLKYCYIGNGAERWDRLRGRGGQSHNAEFELGEREYAGFVKALSLIPELKNPANIIHIGVGNGIELPALFSVFDFETHGYVGVDISYGMVSKAIKYHQHLLRSAKNAFFVVCDIETAGNLSQLCELARRKGHSANLLLLTGEGTLLSNFNVFDNVSLSLESDDLVLISLEGYEYSKRSSMLSVYDLEASRDLYRVGLDKAGIGEGIFSPAEYNDELNRVEVYFKTKDNKKILCLASYKPPSAYEFRERLESHGLNPLHIKYFSDHQIYGAVCKKRTDHRFIAAG